MMHNILRQLRNNDRGSAAVEFALVMPVLFTVMFAGMDIAYRSLIQATLQGAVQKVARDATLETGANQAATLDTKVRNIVKPIIDSGTFTFTRQNYASFTRAGQPENFTDGNGNGVRDGGECFEDENGNGTRDLNSGIAGVGGSKDIVLYTASVSYPRLFPMRGMLGWSSTQTVSSTTVLRNQPFGQQAARTTTVICT
jgi:Flp pilus assembly pilin Flp